DSVCDDRSRHPAAVVLNRIRPHRPEILDVVAIDLRQRTETEHVIGAPIAEPVPRFRMPQTFFADGLPGGLDRLRKGQGGKNQHNDEYEEECTRFFHMTAVELTTARNGEASSSTKSSCIPDRL